MRLLSIAIAVLVASCSFQMGSGRSERIPPHTHLFADEAEQNLWSFESVATLRRADGTTHYFNAPVKSQLAPGDSATFRNGTAVSFDGITLRVGKEPLNSSNTVLNRDGTLHQGAFIRTFR